MGRVNGGIWMMANGGGRTCGCKEELSIRFFLLLLHRPNEFAAMEEGERG